MNEEVENLLIVARKENQLRDELGKESGMRKEIARLVTCLLFLNVNVLFLHHLFHSGHDYTKVQNHIALVEGRKNGGHLDFGTRKRRQTQNSRHRELR